MDEIISEWNAELEKQSREFVKHASKLAEWDRQILTNRHTLVELEDELNKMATGQDALDKRLCMLETHQREVHEALVGMEGEARRMYMEERAMMDDDATERERLYDKAEALSAMLVRMGAQLQGIVGDVNASAAAAGGDPSTPMAKIVRILNNQLHALTQIDARTAQLEGALAQVAGRH